MREIQNQINSNRKLLIYSNYAKGSYILDDNDMIDFKNDDIENISINDMVSRFEENVKPFKIISAYIWNGDKQEIERYIKL